MQSLLPRTELVDSITFSMKETPYVRQEQSEARNMYDKVPLSKIIDMQYTKASKNTILKFNELVLDVKM